MPPTAPALARRALRISPGMAAATPTTRGHYDLIDAGGTRFVFAYMGYHIDQAGMDWLNETFAAYPDRVGVLCVHSYFDSDCTLTDQGRLLYDGVVAKNPNLYLVLCGHRYNSACVPAAFDDDGDGTAERTVLQMICNYQAAGHNGGDAYLRLMQVDEAAGRSISSPIRRCTTTLCITTRPSAARRTTPSTRRASRAACPSRGRKARRRALQEPAGRLFSPPRPHAALHFAGTGRTDE